MHASVVPGYWGAVWQIKWQIKKVSVGGKNCPGEGVWAAAAGTSTCVGIDKDEVALR